MTSRDLRWAVAYQVVAWSALLGIQWVDPGTQAWLLYFTLFPQLWAMVPTRWAAIGTVVVVVAFSLVRWAQSDFSAGSLTEILISGTISMGLSLSLGLFINRIVGEAESRAETIDELRATQARARRAPSATAGCTRSASASRARSTTPWPRASPPWSPSPARRRPRWPGATPPRPVSGSRSSSTRHPTTSTRPG